MTEPNQDDLQRREAALRQRELELRLRELENEVDQTPISPTTKQQPSVAKSISWLRKMPLAAKFFGIVVAVIVAVKVATWMASLLMVAGLVWVFYQVFWASRFK
jgi:hypothetical protein